MKRPPYLLKLRFRDSHHSFGLWLPLFILGPIFLVFLLALFLIALSFAFLSLLFTWRWGWWRPVFLSVPAFFRIVCSLPGLKVDVRENNEQFAIIFD
jgi:hypothetical protein